MTNDNIPNRYRDRNSLMFKNIDTYEDWIKLRDADFSYNPYVSLSKGVITAPDKHVPVREVYDSIKNGTYKDPVEKLRGIFDYKYKYRAMRGLPVVYFGGIHTDYRINLESTSFLLYLHITNVKDIDRTFNRLKFCPFIYMMFIDPLEENLNVIVRVEVYDIGSSSDKFWQLHKYFEKLGLHADTGSQTVSTYCRLSYDPNAYLNESATFFKEIHYYKDYPEDTHDSITKSVELVCSQVERDKIDITMYLRDWNKIGSALVNQFGEDGRDYFHRLSKDCWKYNFEECDKKYSECLSKPESGITIHDLFENAKIFDLRLVIPKEE